MRANLTCKSFSALEFLGGGIALATVALVAVGSSHSARPQASLPARPLHYATASIEPSEASAKLSLQQSGGPIDSVGETRNPQSSEPPSDMTVSKPVGWDATIAPPPAPDRLAPITGGARVALEVMDATGVQQHVIEAGSLGRFTDAIWGPPSHDPPPEIRLVDSPQRKMPNSSHVPAIPSFVGGWTEDIGRCPTGLKAPLVISLRAAKTARGECDFGLVVRQTANRWRVAAICTAEGEFWRAHIAFKLVEPRLTWSSERGTTTYMRCNG
jgi:hypothetical protein